MDGSNNDDTMSCSFVRAIKRLDCPYKLAWHPGMASVTHLLNEKQRHGMVVPVICYIVFLLQIPSPLPLALEIDGVLVFPYFFAGE